jgi:signal peptidase I
MNAPATQHAAPVGEKRESAGSHVRFLLLLMLAAWAFRSLVFQPFNIPSGSMLPTLYIGDYLIVSKWPYGYSRFSFPFGFPAIEGRILGGIPERGDVVVFRHPTEGNDLIKRVIGLPGDTIAVSGGEVILNGHKLAHSSAPPVAIPVTTNSPCRTVPPAQPAIRTDGKVTSCLYPASIETLPGGRSYTVLDQVPDGPGDTFPAVRVPAGYLFVMGDNRDDSLDSRFPTAIGGVGLLPVDHLIGRATITFWSTDGGASFVKPWTWFSALRADRIGNSYSKAAQ